MAKKKTKKEKYVMVCPKCKSPDIHRDVDTKIQGAYGSPSLYVCNKCNHSGYSFPEVELSEFNEFEEEVDKKHERHLKKDQSELLETSIGDIIVKVIWKLLGPGAIVMAFFGFRAKDYYGGGFFLLLGLGLTYISWIKKRKLRDN